MGKNSKETNLAQQEEEMNKKKQTKVLDKNISRDKLPRARILIAEEEEVGKI